MAIDKAVDSTQLNSDLTSVANAIRTKGGTSAALAFPAGFVSAIGDIPTGGGGYSAADIFLGAEPSGVISFKATKNVPAYAVSGRGALTQLTVDLTDGYVISGNGIVQNSGLSRIVLLNNYSAISSRHGSYAISSNSALTQVIMRGNANAFNTSGMRGNSSLQIVDIEYMTHPENVATIGASTFYEDKNLNVLVLRQTDAVVPLAEVGSFGGTKFASGKAGGVLYVPNSMISSYQQAANWSTILGYATNSIEKIEGSPYESLDWWK